MRLAVATAVLSQGWSATSHSSEPVLEDAVRDSTTVWPEGEGGRGLLSAMQDPRRAAVKRRHDGFPNLLLTERKGNGEGLLAEALSHGPLAGSWAEGQKECNPDALEADTGVLSCGAGRYCVESEDSGAGGFCVADIGRALQDEGTGGDLFDIAYDGFCSPEVSSCDCDVDRESYLLYASCSEDEFCGASESRCGVNVTSCVFYENILSITGPGNITSKRCFTYTEPYQQKVCYSGSDGMSGMCTIEIDGEACNSCLAVDSYNETGVPICYDFDCTNTISGKSGSTCFEDVVYRDYVAPIADYISNNGCDDYICPICGGDYFVSTNPGGTISLPGGGESTCAAVAQLALAGAFNETYCTEVVIPGVAEDCGCVASPGGMPTGEGSPPPASAPVEAPSTTPPEGTEAPATGPTPSGAVIAFASRTAVALVGLSAITSMQFA